MRLIQKQYITSKTNSGLGPYNKNDKGTSVFMMTLINTSNAFVRALLSSTQFNTELYNAFAEFYLVYFNTISEYN